MNPSNEDFHATVWYTPGKTTLKNVRGTLYISQDSVSMVDGKNQQVFMLPLNTIKQAVLRPGKIKIKTDSKHYYLFFYDLNQELVKVGEAAAVGEATAFGTTADRSVGNAASAAIASSEIQYITAAAPAVNNAGAILQKYGVKVTGSTNWKRTKIIVDIILGLLVIFAFAVAFYMNR